MTTVMFVIQRHSTSSPTNPKSLKTPAIDSNLHVEGAEGPIK
jgi:hypothetical protein